MDTKLEEIDKKQILDNEFRILVLEGMMNLAINRLPEGTLQQSDIANVQKSAVEKLQKKYPNAGISLSVK